jgi:hypothetical protein
MNFYANFVSFLLITSEKPLISEMFLKVVSTTLSGSLCLDLKSAPGVVVSGSHISSRSAASPVPPVSSLWVDLLTPGHGHHQSLGETTKTSAPAAPNTETRSSKVKVVA